MDEYNDKVGYLFIILSVAFIIEVLFIVNFYHLTRFKKCYDNSFKFPYCEKYQNY